ncbi:hypothetical protein EV361DRAFT_317337 [Lentinula raphanica]|nr:hypothetical protein F5880DRAFT_252410 [Lentinula raphanica]KAJ3976342.1 hypothetical protein EV361DRAFT_317337 [Lentinula raphanica]
MTSNEPLILDDISHPPSSPELVRAFGIGDLPTEILTLIFSTIHSSSRALSSPTTRTASDAVLRLSHVSSTWRETCISVSSLWSHIRIIRGSSNEAKLIELYLERSSPSLLTIDFFDDLADVGSYSAESTRMIRTLFTSCGRWKEASFSAKAQSLEVLMQTLLSRDTNVPPSHPDPSRQFHFPFLEKLAFVHPLESQNRPFFDIFQSSSTPKLRALVIPHYTTFLPFAFTQIYSLQLLKTNLVLLPPICTQLLELTVGQTYGESNESIPSHAVATLELPRVETLTVEYSGPGRLWSMLTLPSLRNLTLKTITFMPLEYVAILNMLRRAGCGLSMRRLILAGVNLRDADVESMLGLMPQLQEFVLKETLTRILTPRLLTALTLSKMEYLTVEDAYSELGLQSTISVVPNLTRIELHMQHSPLKGRLDLLYRMLLSRSSIARSTNNHSMPGLLEEIHLCFMLDQDELSTQVLPVELQNWVNRLRETSASQIQSSMQWKRRKI